MEIKTEVNKWDLMKCKSIYTAKETTSKEKRQPSEWEKIIANETTDKGWISKIYKQLIQHNARKPNNPIKKQEKDLDISPKKTYRWLTNTWKDSQHCSLLEKWKSKLQWDITSHRSEWSSVQFSLVTQSCLTLCHPMNCSTPGLPVHHQLLEFTQTHVHRVGDAIQPSHPLSFPFPPAPKPSQHQSFFQWVNSLHQVAKILELQL